MEPPDENKHSVSRRFANLVLGLGLVGTVCGFAGTALAFLLPGRSGLTASGFISGKEGVLTPGQIGENQGVVGRSDLGRILVIRKGETFIGLQATCSHLGCTVVWNGTSQQVECPCHGARFNIAGQVLRGPAREPLAIVGLNVTNEGIMLATRRAS